MKTKTQAFYSESIYSDMVRATEVHSLPTRFPTDITVHDRAYLSEEHRGESFVWVLHAFGSHIVKHPAMVFSVRSAIEDGFKVYFCDGRSLREVRSLSEASDLLFDATNIRVGASL